LAERGLPVVSIDYRLRQMGRGFHCDIACDEKREAIRWAAEDLDAAIAAISSRFPNGIIASGSSAGAEAVLDATFNMELPQIKGVISVAGAIEPREDWAPVPVLAFHGTCDALVPFCVDAHHYCPEGSPGALELMGGGGLAKFHDLVQLFAFENAGHELASTLLSNPLFIEQSVLFTEAVASQSFEPRTNTIPLHNPCPLSSPPTFPCD
jgi:acetyl esterase/lipase